MYEPPATMNPMNQEKSDITENLGINPSKDMTTPKIVAIYAEPLNLKPL